MYFRNDYMQKYNECPDNVLDLRGAYNGKGMKNIDLMSECCITILRWLLRDCSME